MTLFEILGRITIDNKSAIKGINETETAADKASGKMNTSFGKVGGVLKGALLGGAVAVGTALVAMGIKGVQGASQLEGATDRMQAALGITEGEAKRLGGVAQDVFLNNFGGSVTEAAGMVQTLRQQLGEMSDEQTSKLTQMAATISDVYGADYAQTINTAKTLTDQFGLSNEQAFDFITTGFQKGLNSSGDFLESVNEYSTQFSNGGASADEFFGIMESGLQGGMLGTDKAADAFKEFRLRIQDGSKLTGESLAMLGINADDLAEKISSGQMTAAEAFQLVINKLGETEDPMVRMQAGAGLIGSQFEDLGDTAVQQLSMTTTSLNEMKGATDAAGKAAYDNLGSQMTTLWRTLQTSATSALTPLIPMISNFVGVLIEKAPLMIQAGQSVAAYIERWSPQITQLIGAIGPVVTDIFGLMAALWNNVVKPVWDTIAPYVAGVFSLAAGTIKAFKLILEGDFTGAWVAAIDGLKGFLTGLEGFLDNFFGGLWSLVKPGLIGMRDVILAKGEEIRDGFSAKLNELKTAVFEWSVDLWAGIAATMSSFVGNVITAAVDVYNGFTGEIGEMKDWVVGVFSRLWDDISAHLTAFTQNIVDEIAGIPGRLSDLGQQIADGLMGQIRKAIPGTKKASEELANKGVLEPVTETLDVHSPSRALYAVGTAVVQGLTQGVSDPAEVARVQTAAANLGERVLVAALDGLGITKPENPYVMAGQSMIQGVLDGLESRMPQLVDFWNRVRDARPDVALFTNEWSGQQGPSANVSGSVPVPSSGASALVEQARAVIMPAVEVFTGALVSTANMATAAGTARYHAVIGENQREWQARETERQARRIATDTEIAQRQGTLNYTNQLDVLRAQGALATSQNIGVTLGGAVAWVGSTLSSAASWVGSTISSAASFIGQAAGNIGWELIKLAAAEVPGLGAAMGAMAGGPIAMLTAFFVDLISQTWQFQSIIEVATRIMQPLINTMGRLIEAIWPLISITFARLEIAVNAIAWVFDKILNPAINFVAKTMANVWNALARTLNRVLGWLGVNIPTIDVNAGPVNSRAAAGENAQRAEEARRKREENRERAYREAEEKQRRAEAEKEQRRRENESNRERAYREAEEKRRRAEAEKERKRQEKQRGNAPGYKGPSTPGRPGSPSYKAPGKIGSPGRGSTPGYSAPGGGSSGGGGGGTKVSEITGPTRDFLADAFSSFMALPELVGIGNRTYSLLEANLGPMPAMSGVPALNAGPNITNHIHMVASGDLRYDADQLTKEVTARLAKAFKAQKRGSGG